MPKFKVPFEIVGAVEIDADTEKHAQELFNRLYTHEIAEHGELQSFEVEEVPRDIEGELADRHWDRVKEDRMESA